MMTTSAGTFPGMKKARLWKRAILWWFRGRWWAKVLKITALAVILYNVLAFVFMWCPPVRGVVVDISTGKPIEGAIVQKFGEGPVLFPSEHIEGLWIDGAKAQGLTSADGRFAFPAAAVRPRLRNSNWLEALFPFEWLNTIRVRVWQKDHIGVDSDRHGMWWLQDNPADSKGYCKVIRYRLPFFGYHYKIFLKRAVTEKEWVMKIGSVNLGGIDAKEAAEQERLFHDLTGYLERWPQGEKAGEYFKEFLRFGLPMEKDKEAYWYSNPRRDYSCAELRRMLSANELISSLLPRMDLAAVYANDPLGETELERDLPDGYERGSRYAKWLLRRECDDQEK